MSTVPPMVVDRVSSDLLNAHMTAKTEPRIIFLLAVQFESGEPEEPGAIMSERCSSMKSSVHDGATDRW